MTVHIKLADTADEFDQLFQLRHRVFSEEKGYAHARDDGRLCDRFDAFPGVANVIAVIAGRVVGGLRIVADRGAGTSADAWFDFAPHLPPRGASRVGSVGMLVIDSRYRKGPVFFPIVGVAHTWASQQRLTHLVAPLAPGVEPAAYPLGYVALAPRFRHEGTGLWVTPLVLEMKHMSARLASFVAAQRTDYVLHGDGLPLHEDKAA